MIFDGVDSMRKFSEAVVGLVSKNKDLSWMDATLEACDIFEIDVSVVKPFLSKTIREKIEEEASRMKMINRTSGNLRRMFEK